MTTEYKFVLLKKVRILMLIEHDANKHSYTCRCNTYKIFLKQYFLF